jgi:hypothetical protein
MSQVIRSDVLMSTAIRGKSGTFLEIGTQGLALYPVLPVRESTVA